MAHADKQHQRFAGRMVRALAHLRQCHSDMTVQQAMILLHIAANPGVTQRALYEALDANDSVASRTLAVLSNIGMRDVRGLNLVELTINPEDRRERLLTLTPAGTAIDRRNRVRSDGALAQALIRSPAPTRKIETASVPLGDGH